MHAPDQTGDSEEERESGRGRWKYFIKLFEFNEILCDSKRKVDDAHRFRFLFLIFARSVGRPPGSVSLSTVGVSEFYLHWCLSCVCVCARVHITIHNPTINLIISSILFVCICSAENQVRTPYPIYTQYVYEFYVCRAKPFISCFSTKSTENGFRVNIWVAPRTTPCDATHSEKSGPSTFWYLIYDALVIWTRISDAACACSRPINQHLNSKQRHTTKAHKDGKQMGMNKRTIEPTALSCGSCWNFGVLCLHCSGNGGPMDKCVCWSDADEWRLIKIYRIKYWCYELMRSFAGIVWIWPNH